MIASKLWFFSALGAAFLWGIGYVLSEKLLRQGFTPAFLMFASDIITLPFYFLLVWYLGELKGGISLALSDWKTLSLLVLVALTVIGGNFLIFTSIADKNATMASIIEITYPLFTCLFAWLLLKDVQISWQTAMGGLFILVGVIIIYIKGDAS